MDPIFKKMQLKNQERLLVENAPESFRPHLDEVQIDFELDLKRQAGKSYDFCLVFAEMAVDLAAALPGLQEHLPADALVWFAYPKKSSKKYKSDITRDNGWEGLGEWGYEPVRMVAIDADWSAMRFRPAEQIKKLTRNPKMLLSEQGKKKSAKDRIS